MAPRYVCECVQRLSPSLFSSSSSEKEKKEKWRPALLLLLPAVASPHHLRRRRFLRRRRHRPRLPSLGAPLSPLAPWRCRRASLDEALPRGKRTLPPSSRPSRAKSLTPPSSSMRRPPQRRASPAPPPLAPSLVEGTGRCVFFLLLFHDG